MKSNYFNHYLKSFIDVKVGSDRRWRRKKYAESKNFESVTENSNQKD